MLWIAISSVDHFPQILRAMNPDESNSFVKKSTGYPLAEVVPAR
jgi:hypothetical protein